MSPKDCCFVVSQNMIQAYKVVVCVVLSKILARNVYVSRLCSLGKNASKPKILNVCLQKAVVSVVLSKILQGTYMCPDCVV